MSKLLATDLKTQLQQKLQGNIKQERKMMTTVLNVNWWFLFKTVLAPRGFNKYNFPQNE